jgi:LmbE family N-acetylglucosaminyl deacetylase
LAAAQLAPPSSGGIVALDRLLHRISEHRRVLVVGAHPDDEDTSLLALLALGYGAEAAYLSLSRGEGGQNLIGDELGTGLGLLRSRELVAARDVDGATQFFTRAFDFGYTRSLQEASQHWVPDSILKDVVRVVRAFRPHVIVSTWSGTERDRHGQHQASGVAATAAFEAAGDQDRFPELNTEEGLEAWTSLKLFRSTRFDTTETTVTLPTGELDVWAGRSYHQIAMASRSRHRSQDMGQLQGIGPRHTRLRLLRDRTTHRATNGEGGGGLFAGIPADTSELARFARDARRAIDPTAATNLTPRIAEELQRSYAAVEREPARTDLLEQALLISAGVVIDAVASDEELIPGQAVDVTVSVYNGGPHAVSLDSIAIQVPSGWRTVVQSGGDATLAAGALVSREFTVTAPPEARPTQPYFLERPLVGSLYDWSVTSPDVRGMPFQTPLLRTSSWLSVLGARARSEREVSYRFRDQALGEVRRELRVVPRLDVRLEPSTVIWPAGGEAERQFTVSLTYNGSGPYAGDVGLEIDGWPAPPRRRFSFERTGESVRLDFVVQRPRGVSSASVDVRAVAAGEDGTVYGEGVELISYPHVRATARVRTAQSEVRVVPLAMPAVSSVGYVRGAADRVPEALMQIGLPIEVLSDEQIARADLSRFDAVVIGSRAHESNPALTRNNDRFLEFARSGGLLVVQYQQYAFVSGGYAPHPLTIGRPHGRVTDETAPVRVLDPDHMIFTEPNRITLQDWEGWPQERGLYFAETWDDAYRPLLEMNDAGYEPLRGGLLVAGYGAGTYVYTGLSFFRALPAGAPGAFRLFVNLLNLKPEHVR